MRDRRQIQTFGKVVPDQTFGILIGRKFSGTVSIGKIDVDLQSLGQHLVAGHLFALIVGQRLSHARRDMTELAGEGFQGGLGSIVAQFGHQQVRAPAFYQGTVHTPIFGALDRIALLMAWNQVSRDPDETQVYLQLVPRAQHLGFSSKAQLSNQRTTQLASRQDIDGAIDRLVRSRVSQISLLPHLLSEERRTAALVDRADQSSPYMARHTSMNGGPKSIRAPEAGGSGQ